ncbi:rifin PIR protein, putative [Plasmodium reichenowi]|uniref:Rifin PIR protein, putative n=1 Tax=Plasmodium reichenowi TaxID=5854 RepID=A0A2P9DST4_PLARE|nr:rifin PIR protein, putative [Plasmodium reichenowi]
MKLHCSKILLFVLPINILLKLSSNEHNKNKPSITPHHTPTTTSRVLSECDTQSSNYDKDADMISVKEIFERQTSKRFEEYEERMKDKRQKRKEQRDKNIEKIIEEDKREKSLADKVEKGCLMCGCGLGSVAASVGIFGTVAVKELTKTATAAAVAAAEKEAIAEATQAGMKAVIPIIERSSSIYEPQAIARFISIVNEKNFKSAAALYESVVNVFSETCKNGGSEAPTKFCNFMVINSEDVTFKPFTQVGATAYDAKLASETPVLKAAKVGAVDAKYATCQTAIIASVVALLIIVLAMIIIYLILRHRRKKKMKKKAQYTKLLEE